MCRWGETLNWILRDTGCGDVKGGRLIQGMDDLEAGWAPETVWPL
jgi:hypothetical protein